MAYSLSFPISLGATYAGLTLNGQLVDSAGADSGDPITTGFVEIGDGCYLLTTSVPDSFAGIDKIYEQGDTVIFAAGDASDPRLPTIAAAQTIRDAMKLAPTAGAPATDSIDKHLDDILVSSSLGTGARTVIATVNDGTDPLESAIVRYTKGAETYTGTTNASGQVTFSLDDGTWTVAVTLPLYTFTSTTLVVDGDETPTYSMAAQTVAASDSGLVTGYFYCYDEEGAVEEGVIVQSKMKSCVGYGISYDVKTRSKTSDSDGLVEFTNLKPGATYQFRRGEEDQWEDVTIPATAVSPYAIYNILGEDD